jgi:hypothetical protein
MQTRQGSGKAKASRDTPKEALAILLDLIRRPAYVSGQRRSSNRKFR